MVRMAEMLMSLGHEVYCYGAKSEVGKIPNCTEFIEVLTVTDIRKDYGDGNNLYEIGYDYFNSGFRTDYNTDKKESTIKAINNCVKEINIRKKKDDFLLLFQGSYHEQISNQVNLFLTCEPGIGYRGSMPKHYRAFESAYIQNFSYGSSSPFQSINGSYYDRVISNYLDAEDFEFSNTADDYFLFIGRIIERKGIWTAIKATQATNKKLIIAGQKDSEINVNNFPENCTFIGSIDAGKRKRLMSKAIATFVPTIYLEPFATVHAESLLSGTPVITTSFGVFGGNTFIDGVHGFKCNTLDDFVWATENAHSLDRNIIGEYGKRFLVDNVKWEFQRWWEDLYQVYLSTIDPTIKGWHYIRNKNPEWRTKFYTTQI